MEKELQLLYSRLRKLDERGFDLNSWKQGTIAVIDSILGPASHHRRLIEGIDFQNNSWSLRDTTGDVDSVKKTCADVLETIILEIETLGLAEKSVPLEKSKTVDSIKLIEEALKKELSQSQLSDLKDLLRKTEVENMDVVDKFKRFGYEVAPKILADILLSPEFKKSL
jgi:hypothetical protein